MNNLIKNIKKLLSSNEQGMALLATLVLVFVLGSTGVALLTMTGSDSKLSTLQRESNRAFYLAETGIEEALWYMNFSPENSEGMDWETPEGETYDGGTENEYYKVKVEKVGGYDEDRIKFTSTGVVDNSSKYNQGKRTIEAFLVKGTAQNNSVFYNHAIFTDDDTTIHGNIFVNGDIHANGDLSVSGAAFELANGTASATGEISGYNEGINQPRQKIPTVLFDHYKQLAEESGKYYGDDKSKVFSSTETIEGIHFIDGDVTIKPPCSTLTINDGAIFATGTIKVQGNVDINVNHSENYDNPYSLVSQGDITMGGNVHGEGIIQTEGSFTLNGGINIQKGAVVAEDGVFNGGGGTMNIVYDDGFQEEVVVGTGIEVWKLLSWREI
ncbi:MAG: hypothetical protein ACOCVN_01330 [bacterium]